MYFLLFINMPNIIVLNAREYFNWSFYVQNNY